jgi:hypothetical protein
MSRRKETNTEKRGWRWTERGNWIAGIIGVLITVGGGLVWGLKGGHIVKQSNPNNQQQGNTNISSFNQSGGITAHTVNLGPTPRVIGVEKRQHFQDSSRDAPKGNITVRFVADNDESHDFAMQFHSLLGEAGYNVTAGVWPVMHLGTPVKGVQLEVRDKDNPPNFAKVLQALLEEIGIGAHRGARISPKRRL